MQNNLQRYLKLSDVHATSPKSSGKFRLLFNDFRTFPALSDLCFLTGITYCNLQAYERSGRISKFPAV